MKRDDDIIHVVAGLPMGGGSYSMMDDMGQYADPRQGVARAVNVFPPRAAVAEVCFGIGCCLRGNCARYLAVDGANPDAPRMARCADHDDFMVTA